MGIQSGSRRQQTRHYVEAKRAKARACKSQKLETQRTTENTEKACNRGSPCVLCGSRFGGHTHGQAITSPQQDAPQRFSLLALRVSRFVSVLFSRLDIEQGALALDAPAITAQIAVAAQDRKSTRLNSSH